MAAAGGSLVAVKSVPVAFQGKPRKSADLKRTENAEKQRGSPRKGDCGCDILLGACRARSVSPVAVPATPAAPASLPPPPSPQERHGLHSNRPRSLTSMEEDVILKQLSSGTQTAGKRVEAIKATRGYIYSNPGKLLFKKRNELLTAVVEVLEKDARRDVKAQCVQLVCDIVQIPDPELDRFRQAVLPGLLFDLKDESPSMRKELVQTLHKCLKYSRSPEKILSALVEHGLESREASVRTATVVLLPILLPKDFHSVDLYDIIESLTKKLTNISGSSGPNDPVVAFSTLDYIRQHLAVGQDEFNAYLKRLPPGLRRDYNRFIDDNFEQLSVDNELNNNNTPRSAYPRGRCPSPSPAAAVSGGSPSLNDSPLILSPLKEHSGMKYGIVPLDLHSRLLDLKDYKARTHAVEELKSVISHTDLSNVPPANVLGLIGFLCSLLDDSNFKVTHSTLEILNLLVVKLGRHVEQFLRAVVTTAVKVLGDNKAVTKQAYMKVYMGLMKNAGPQKLLDLLLENVKHRNSKVREEVINIIIASLLTHPSEDFDLPKLCFAVAPALADGKRKVRHAALEVFAVLASSMGSGKMQSLVKAVDQVELHEDVDGLMAAVQARLARRTLPKLTAHGLVEYAVPIAASAHGRASQQVPQGADTEWLFGGGRTSSATSNRGDTERGPHQGHRSTSPQGEETPIHRRVLSASKGKNKLPWENTNTPTKTPFQPAKAPNDTDTITKEQVSQIYGEVPQSPKLRRSPTMPANDDLFITRKSAVKSAKQGNVQAMNLVNSSTLTNTGAAEWHQPRISGKQGLLGYSRSSGSVDSDLQFLGTSSQLEKAPLHASLNLSTKTQRGLYSHPSVERTLSGPSTAGGGSSSSSSIASQGAFILPSYPLSSPGSGQLHTTPPRKGMEDSVGFSNTWPSKPLDGTSNSSPRKRLPSSRTDDTQVDMTQEKHSPVPLKPALVRTPSSRRGINGTKPVPPHPKGASLGNTQQQNNHDVTSANGMHEDSVVIVGKGVFGSPTASLTYSQAMLCSAENGDGAGKHSTETPPAIYGKSVQQNSHSTFESSDQAEREVTVAISKSARDKMRRRKNKAEREQLLREQERKERLEESLRERLRAIDIDSSPDDLIVNGGVLLKSKAESLSAESTPLSPPPLKCTPSLRKARSPSSDEVSAGPRTQRKQRASSIPRASETVEPSDVRPFSKPEQALLDALRLMADDDWEKKIEGIGFVRSLSIYHPDVLTTRLHDIALAMIREVKNLRSGVSRVAVMCLGDMFTHLKVMEQELDGTVRALLHKAGESNTFIREDVDKALGAMVSNVTPARALCALIAGGSSHLNSVVRKCTALHLSGLVERMGPGRLLSGIRDVTDRLLPVVAKFTQDSSPETRYYGRRMIYLMMSHQDFDKVLEKYLTPKDLPYIKDTVHNLRLKGLGEIPQDAPSARGRRSLPGSGTTRASSNTRDPHSSIAREPGESTWKPAVRNLVDNHEFIKQLTGTLNSKDFRERIKGIHQLVSECETNQDLIISNMFPIFDAFKTRLHDSNSKVCLMALESLQKIILLLGNHLSQVVYILVPAIVDTNLNSKNSAVYTAAINALHCLSEQLDNSVLLQPFCTKAQYLTGKAKQDMTEKVADLVTELYPRKPQLVEQRVLPLLWHLLSSVSSGSTLPGKGSSMRGSTAKLCKALSEHMGDSNLLSLAASKSPQTSKNVLELLAITT
ncbi:TOG array regulator of axonemal microtubules protein 1-like [Acipenser ruthenus]|uniref:TOG array regulator of axonemal microtubules protein 1-like n=1 Tax=Acipenser ruthenus TaxID=7906 RepID=UPI00274051CC|nr:TOG array regulator of axonemal microtubules protein 1-like [Acipenser ruthenus]